jgi:hypothetical protein
MSSGIVGPLVMQIGSGADVTPPSGAAADASSR